MKQEKENLNDKVETLDAKVKSLEEVIEARDEEITEDLDVSTRNLDQANKELAEYEKLVREAELEVSALQRLPRPARIPIVDAKCWRADALWMPSASRSWSSSCRRPNDRRGLRQEVRSSISEVVLPRGRG